MHSDVFQKPTEQNVRKVNYAGWSLSTQPFQNPHAINLLIFNAAISFGRLYYKQRILYKEERFSQHALKKITRFPHFNKLRFPFKGNKLFNAVIPFLSKNIRIFESGISCASEQLSAVMITVLLQAIRCIM